MNFFGVQGILDQYNTSYRIHNKFEEAVVFEGLGFVLLNQEMVEFLDFIIQKLKLC
jgi:hypothetical protein